MAKLKIIKIIRSGKFQSRVETSDNKQLVLDHTVTRPYVGMELDIEEVVVSKGELRPLRDSDKWPELLASDLDI